MRSYSKDSTITEFMDAPCLCDCGNYFDLNDGFTSEIKDCNSVVCPECHETEIKINETLAEIERLTEMKNKKRELKELKKTLLELENEYHKNLNS